MVTDRSPHSILITGASSGLGEALAIAYAQPGNILHLIARNAGRLQAVAHACVARGAVVHSACIDVREREAMHCWIAAQDRHLPIDIAIANAGISAGTGSEGESEAQAKAIFDVNVQGVLNSIWPLIPAMESRRFGTIALVGSLAGSYPIPSAPAYSASKAAIRYYGEALRVQLAASHVRVVMLYPGFIDTPMTRVNPFPMPQLMPVDIAAQRIIHAIACGKPRVFFPFLLSVLVRALHILPASLVQKRFSSMPAKPRIS